MPITERFQQSPRLREWTTGLPNRALLAGLNRIQEVFIASEVSKRGLPVYYPGAGWDITFPLAMTDAREFVFVDFLYYTENEIEPMDKGLAAEIRDLGGEITSDAYLGVMGEGGKRVLKFNLDGIERKITLYAEDATKFQPDELKEGASFVVIKAPTPESRTHDIKEVPGDLKKPENTAKVYSALAVGGFFTWNPNLALPISVFGFKEIMESHEGFPLYQKVKEEPEIEGLLLFDRALEISQSKRYGSWICRIDEQTIDSYRASLKELRDLFDKLTPAKQKEILSELYYFFDPDEEYEEVILDQLVRFGVGDKDDALEFVETTFQMALRHFPELESI